MSKALFFDIDGTLFSRHVGIDRMPEGLIAQLRRIQGEGNRLFICTGRPKMLIPPELEDFGFDGFVMSNGGHVVIDGETVYLELMGAELATASADLLVDLGFQFTINSAHHTYLLPEYTVMRDYFGDRAARFTYEFDRAAALSRAIKLETFPTPGEREHIQQVFAREIGPVVAFNNNGTKGTYELYSARLSKATGIKMALEHYGIAIEDSYGFGDGTNDLAMIRTCGTGVAMGNACDELKAEADVVCGKVEDRGLELCLLDLFPL